MKACLAIAVVAATISTFALPVMAQESVPPEVGDVGWFIYRNIGGDPQFGPYDPPLNDFPDPFDPAVDVARELDILVPVLAILDPDFHDEGADTTDCGDQVYYRQRSFWAPLDGYLAPEPPGISEDLVGFCCQDGFCPGSGDVLFLQLTATIPDFLGRSQAHLRGLNDEFGDPINWDARMIIQFLVSNNSSPTLEDNVFVGVFGWSEIIKCEQNPAIVQPNAQAFADAGPDLVVDAGTTVLLDGSDTFDSFNVGFNPSSRNVFEKDNISYAWEFVSGPENVSPVYRDPASRPAIAEVTLNAVGTYIYRLTADDGVNALPTTDSMKVEVIADTPDNRAPIGRASGPTGPVVVGSAITLDGTASFDPDGDPLGYRWQQTDEVGGTLPTDEAARVFQPMSGVESPISSWQAVAPGTFYFRLLVSDGEFVGSDRISVRVIDAAAAGALARRRGPSSVDGLTPLVDSAEAVPAQDSSAGGSQAQPTATPSPLSACGTGLLAPLAVVPFALWFARGKRR